nr:ORF3 [Torque teno felis virus]
MGSLLHEHFKDSCNRAAFLMSDDRSPSKNNLRGILTRRSMMKREMKPKKVKRSRKKRAIAKQLFDVLGSAYSESELSDTASTSSSNPF